MIFLREDPVTQEGLYAINMPITGNREVIRVSEESIMRWGAYNALYRAKSAYNYYKHIHLLHVSRDFRPMSGDLAPITEEEYKWFNVRLMHA